MQRVLITGISGFIGKSVLRSVLDLDGEYKLYGLVRPGTAESRIREFKDQIEISYIDLGDSSTLRSYLDSHEFDTIIHIGALRGGRKFSRENYYRSNVVSVEVICAYCIKNSTTLLFCSSVGIFGAIPLEIPANNFTQRVNDNYYHYTKIEAEKVINRAIMSGLKVAILRPSITYGIGDYGFPYQLVKMIKQRSFPLVTKKTWIHLCHINTVTSAFIWFLQNDFPTGSTFNVADREPVQLKDLVNFVSRQLKQSNYPKYMQFDPIFFKLFEFVFRLMMSELWISRIELISKSWFYEVKDFYTLTGIKPSYTIPEFETIIAEFK